MCWRISNHVSNEQFRGALEATSGINASLPAMHNLSRNVHSFDCTRSGMAHKFL